MIQYYPQLSHKIAEMADGDPDFQVQLTTAITSGLKELSSKYEEGQRLKDEQVIQQIRHKAKPTLMMFGFDDLIEFLKEGKEILDQEGFGPAFEAHGIQVSQQVDRAIEQLHSID